MIQFLYQAGFFGLRSVSRIFTCLPCRLTNHFSNLLRSLCWAGSMFMFDLYNSHKQAQSCTEQVRAYFRPCWHLLEHDFLVQ